ncbi:MAG TPA: hydrophobe/amphiphile efflux-1 family RND transporter, partial [Neisseriales bacterium]|nr:hydrophobe/amphiphile efflux-1 family RND transporter [Neisseriales bacterium]
MRRDFFINRPILAAAISLFICLCGIVALFKLPVSQFPEISPPSISVRASFPGANAETSAKVVAAQIEEHLNGLSNLLYMTTNTSSTGGINIQLTYEVGTNLDNAINEVLNRLYAAKAVLPAIVQKMGINARKSSSDSLMTLAFYSDPYLNPTWVSNYLQRVVMNDLYLIPSVGNVSVRGAGKYSITAWLDPNKMARYKLGMSEVAAAINDQNQEYVIGRSNSSPAADASKITLNLIGQQMYSTAAELANTIVRNDGNQTIRIKDFARVELTSNDTTTMANTNFIDESGAFKRYPITT